MERDFPQDTSTLAMLGQRLSRARLDRNLTQEELATEAAVSKRTVERLERGESVQLSNFIRVLNALKLSANLEQLAPPVETRPIELLKRRGKIRRRASLIRKRPAPWTWNDTP